MPKRYKNKRSLTQRVKDVLSTLIARETNQSGWPAVPRITIIEGQPLTISKQFIDYATEGYGGNVWVYRAIRKIVDTASEVEWKLVREDASGEEIDVDTSPLIDRMKHPNGVDVNKDIWTWHDFIETIILHLELSGNCFIHRAMPLNELNVLRPDLVEIIPGPLRTIARYDYTIDEAKGKKVSYKPEEVLHIMFVDPVNELDGIAPAEAAARSIDLNNVSRQWNFAKLQNTVGLSHVFLTGDQPFTEQQIEQTKDIIDEQYRGPGNAGKMAVVEANSIESLSDTPKDMDWSEIMNISAIEVSVAFGVPYVLLHPEGATYENLDHAKRQLWTETIFPLLDKIKDSFNNWLVPLYGEDLEITFDKEAVSALQEDIESKAVWVLSLATNHIIDVNEAREMLNLETRPDCDMWLEPSTLLTSPTGGEVIDTVTPPSEPAPVIQPVIAPPPGDQAAQQQQLSRLIGEIRKKYNYDKKR
jgi:HK97 family phage portal protein